MFKVQYYPSTAIPLFSAIHDENPVRQYSRRLELIRAHLNDIRRITVYPITTHYYLHWSTTMANNWKKDFVNIRLQKTDQPLITAFAENFGNDVDELMVELLTQGYKVTLSWVDSKNAFCASLVGTDKSKFNQESVLTSFSDVWQEAIFINGYKHLELCKSGDWHRQETLDNWG